MRRAIQILSIFVLLTLATVVRAQTPACGVVGVDGPTKVQPGEIAVFNARLTGVPQVANLTIKWHVSAGTITSGQGTDTISVDTVNLAGQNVTATAEVSGVPVGCNASLSKTIEIAVNMRPCGMAFDRYGDIKFFDEQARLDNFWIQVSHTPQSIGYLMAAAGPVTFKNEAEARLERAKSYLVKKRQADPARIVTLDCGYDSHMHLKLYVIMPGETPPTCDLFQQVPLSEIKFTKPRRGSSKKRR